MQLPSLGTFVTVPVFALMVVVGYGMLWVDTATTVQTLIDDTAGEMRGDGYEISYTEAKVTGFPLRIVANLTNVEVKTPESAGKIGFTADHITVGAAVFSPRIFEIALVSDARAKLSDWRETLSPLNPEFDLTADRLSLNLTRTDTNKIVAVELVADNVALDGAAEGGPVRIGMLRAQSADFNTEDLEQMAEEGTDIAPNVPVPDSIALDPDAPPPEQVDLTPTKALSLRLENLEYPESLVLLLPSPLSDLDIRATVRGRIPPGNLGSALEAWRASGGIAELHRLYLDWRPLTLTAQGTVALDSGFRPQAALTATALSFFKAIESMESRGTIRRAPATMAKIVLPHNSRRTRSGRLAIDFPISIQNGVMTAGQVKLAELPNLEQMLGFRAPLKPGFEIGRFGEIIRQE